MDGLLFYALVSNKGPLCFKFYMRCNSFGLMPLLRRGLKPDDFHYLKKKQGARVSRGEADGFCEDVVAAGSCTYMDAKCSRADGGLRSGGDAWDTNQHGARLQRRAQQRGNECHLCFSYRCGGWSTRRHGGRAWPYWRRNPSGR